jgi:membrane fusion protein (multidrug efflux system)
VGDSAQVTIDALGPEQFQGVITRTHPSLDPVTRRGIIEVELSPVPTGALPGQLCRVTLNTHTGNRLIIPFRALRRDTEGEYVFVVNKENIAERVTVTSGLRMNEHIEILPALKNGLTDGQQVITKGFLSLKAGKKVKSVTKPTLPTEETNNTKPHLPAAPKPE